jgi:hypothetical protein
LKRLSLIITDMSTVRLFLILIAFICGCKKPIIKGTVVDNYNRPIEGVMVKIEGTQFECKTDISGKYSVSYVPGKINMSFKKNGYSQSMKQFDISVEDFFPAETVQLIKLPEEKGAWFMGSDTLIFIPSKTVLEHNEYGNAYGLFYNRYLYYCVIAIWDFTPIVQSSKHSFLVKTDNPFLLVKAFDYEKFNNVLYAKYFGGFANNSEGKYTRILGNINKLDDDVSLAEYTLSPGKYAFLEFLNTPEKPYKEREPFRCSFYTSAQLFEIIDSIQLKLVNNYIGTWSDGYTVIEIESSGSKFRIRSCYGFDAIQGVEYWGVYKNGKIIAIGNPKDFYKFTLPSFGFKKDTLKYLSGAGVVNLLKSDKAIPQAKFSSPKNYD